MKNITRTPNLSPYPKPPIKTKKQKLLPSDEGRWLRECEDGGFESANPWKYHQPRRISGTKPTNNSQY